MRGVTLLLEMLQQQTIIDLCNGLGAEVRLGVSMATSQSGLSRRQRHVCHVRNKEQQF